MCACVFVRICGVYYAQLALSARTICTCISVCAWHVQVHTWVRVHVWSSVCFLMCVSQHCSPLSSNCSSMLKPAVCPEIVREADDGSWCYPQILQNTSLQTGRVYYVVCNLSFLRHTWLYITCHLSDRLEAQFGCNAPLSFRNTH